MAKNRAASRARRRASADAGSEVKKPRRRPRTPAKEPRPDKQARRKTRVDGAAKADGVTTADGAAPTDGVTTAGDVTKTGGVAPAPAEVVGAARSDGSAPATRPLRVIEAPAPGLRHTLAEWWRHRSAYGFFFRAFMRKRYGRTFFGYLWFFIPILLPMAMGALVFGGILGVSVGTVPYFLYFIIASSAWLLFSQTAYFATRSLEITRSDLRKVYVPRLIPLTAGMTLPGIAMCIYVLIIACATGFYVWERGEFYLELRLATLLVPVAVVMLTVYGLACGLWFSPLAPRARDVRRLASYVLGMWYFLTPVIYPIDEIPEGFRFLAQLNPITAPIEMVKDGMLDIGEVTVLGLAIYAGTLVVVTAMGLRIFRAKERRDMGQYY